jgi:long-chain fatty acid transport protein
MRRASSALFAFVSLLAVTLPASAQLEPPEAQIAPPPVQYNFAPPGARSLAMGASFLGLADDATASESNPAGLTILTKPEFSAHFRYSEFENHAPNTVTGEGFETFTTRLGSPSFFSVVYPWKRAAVSLYYQRAADFRSRSLFGDFLSEEFYNDDLVDVRFRAENIGLSAAFKPNDKVSVGGSLRATRVQMDSLQQVTLVFPLDSSVVARYVATNTIESTETKASFNAGILITPTPKLSLGGVYKRGVDLDFSATAQATADAQFVDPITSPVARGTIRVTVPDVFGGGIAVRPTDQFTILADVVRVQWSQADLGEDQQNGYQLFGEGGREALQDGTEFHTGIEYTFARGNDWIFSVRGGYYFDPDHDGLAGLDSDQNHATFGGGVVVKNKLQVDVAANLADAIKEGLISFVVRF